MQRSATRKLTTTGETVRLYDAALPKKLRKRNKKYTTVILPPQQPGHGVRIEVVRKEKLKEIRL